MIIQPNRFTSVIHCQWCDITYISKCIWCWYQQMYLKFWIISKPDNIRTNATHFKSDSRNSVTGRHIRCQSLDSNCRRKVYRRGVVHQSETRSYHLTCKVFHSNVCQLETKCINLVCYPLNLWRQQLDVNIIYGIIYLLYDISYIIYDKWYGPYHI